jgi:hypothetical protein
MQKHFDSVHSDFADSDFVHSDSADSDSAHSDSADSDFVHSDSADLDSAYSDSESSNLSPNSSLSLSLNLNLSSNSNSIDSNLIAHFNDINRVISIDEKIHSIKSRMFTSHWVTSLSNSTQLMHFLELNLTLHALCFIRHDWQKVLTSLLWRRILVAMIECFLLIDRKLRFDEFESDALFILKTKMLE